MALHRRKIRFEWHIDQRRSLALQRLLEGLLQVGGTLYTLGMHSSAARPACELDGRGIEINADVGLGFGGWPIVGVQAPLEDQVLAVVTDNKNAPQPVACRRP